MQNDLMFPNTWLTDMNAVLRHRMNAENTAEWDANELDLLADFIEQASAEIRGELGWLTIPYHATLSFDWSSQYISRDSQQLWLFNDAPLLEITTLTNGDLNTISSSQYALKENNEYPKTIVQLKSSACIGFKAASSGAWEQAISIDGIWGYVPHYVTCWKLTGQTVQNEGEEEEDPDEMSASATNLEVSSTAGFSRGWYLQIEDETLFVEAVVDDTNLTVERGALGTTAAAHAKDTPVRRFVHDNIIYRAATEWASYLYKSKDQLGQQVEVYEGGLSIQNGLSPRLYYALMKRQRVSAGSAS